MSNIETSRKSFGADKDDFPADAPDSPHSFDFGDASPIGEAEEENVTVRRKSDDKRRFSSFGDGPGFDDDANASSPFAVDEEPLSPLSDGKGVVEAVALLCFELMIRLTIVVL